MKLTTLQKDFRQSGMALILAIGFLAILSILGAVILNIATRGLTGEGGAASVQPKQQALYAADRAVEYAMNYDIILNMPPGGSVDLTTDVVLQEDGTPVTGVTHEDLLETIGVGTLEAGNMTDIGPVTLPPILAEIYGTEFGANLYHVGVRTRAANSDSIHVDASLVRLFKMDDESIFHTSGGG